MAQNYPDFRDFTGAWVDLTTLPAYSATASAKVLVQNKGSASIYVYYSSSATAPTGLSDGVSLAPGEFDVGTAAHVFVNSEPGEFARIGVKVED